MRKGYIVFISSICPSIHPSVHPFVIPSVNIAITKFYFEVFSLHISLQPLFILGMGVPGRVLFHSTSVDPWDMPWGRARGQNLGHLNKVVYCSLFIQTT